MATAIRSRDAKGSPDSDCTQTLVAGPLCSHSARHGHAMTSQQAAETFMLHLWQAAEGTGVLREALSALQKVRRSACGQDEPAHAGYQVRRLTVEECEALQGFPRGYTAIQYRGKPAADGPRYRALGNSMAVPVMRWIAERIQEVEELCCV